LSSVPADAGADGTMVVQWLMRGTNTGPWNGQPPTGRVMAVRGVDVFTVKAGKITSAEGYFDRQGLAEQLGFQMRPLPRRPARSSSATPPGPPRGTARSPAPGDAGPAGM
jgi:SnoaL-like polyketide cyclase